MVVIYNGISGLLTKLSWFQALLTHDRPFGWSLLAGSLLFNSSGLFRYELNSQAYPGLFRSVHTLWVLVDFIAHNCRMIGDNTAVSPLLLLGENGYDLAITISF